MLEDSPAAGGRLSTLTIGNGLADNGAQFFTVREPEFQKLADGWVKAGLAYVWTHGWSDGTDSFKPDGFPRYAIHGGMCRLAEHLADGLDLRLPCRVTSVYQNADSWQLSDGFDETYDARALLLTPPLTESLELLPAGTLNGQDLAVLTPAAYEPSLTGVFLLDGPSQVPAPGGVMRPGARTYWIADNQQKGISPDACTLTAHLNQEASRAHWEDSDGEILAVIEEDLAAFLGTSKIVETHLSRWLSAIPVAIVQQRFFVAHNVPPLAFCGDAFGGPRVEGAALSGLAAAEALIAGW